MRTGIFAGYVGKDAEVKYTGQGIAVANFSLAVNIGNKDNPKTLWVDCAIWRDRAEKLAAYITKGKFLTVQGEIDARSWIGKNDGDPHHSITCSIDKLTFGPGGDKPPAVQPPEPTGGSPITDEDIPF